MARNVNNVSSHRCQSCTKLRPLSICLPSMLST